MAGFNESGVPLSAPGALSSRTDLPAQSPMALSDPAYGEQQDFQEIQAGAPMPGGGPSMGMPPGLFDETMQPDVPLTDGADMGPGAGPEAMIGVDQFTQDTQMIAKYLPQFEAMASMETTPESFRQFVRFLRGSRV